MKTLLAIILTALLMLQLFYYSMLNAEVKFGYTADGRQLVAIDLGVQEFNYWEVENATTD